MNETHLSGSTDRDACCSVVAGSREEAEACLEEQTESLCPREAATSSSTSTTTTWLLWLRV